MRRIFDFCNRAVKRVNARIAILVVVIALGGVAAWQGYARMARTAPKGPTKEIATGVEGEASLDPTIQPAGATLTDDQMPAGSPQSGSVGFGQSPTPVAEPQTNPYLPSNNDGYGTGSVASSTPASGATS